MAAFEEAARAESQVQESSLPEESLSNADILDSDTFLEPDTDPELDLAEQEFLDAGLSEPEMMEIDNTDPEMLDLDLDSELLADTLANQIEDADTEPDPLDEYEQRVEEKKTGLRNSVIAATIMIGLCFGGYQFWQNRQELSWHPTWAGITQLVCSAAPCDIKPRRDVASLVLKQRIVEPSELNEKKLDIKILLINEADFAQPYPRITINFSNQLGEQVATQQFEVKDYFAEKVGVLIPASAEVHLSFHTDVPHPNALGFEFIFD